jgi:tetratricopeptide (TPR) repeat protein
MPTKMSVKLDTLLILGDFLGIKALRKDLNIDLIWYSIAAEVFLGNLEEASAIFEKYQLKMDADSKSSALFFLLIGMTRKSDYLGAHKIIAQQKILSRSTTNPYFIYQSYAFLHFFYSHFTKAKKYVETALTLAINHDFTFGSVISYDLLGHTLVQLGEIAQGKRMLETAKDICFKVGPSKLAESIDTSILKFICNFSDQPLESLKLLDAKITTLNVQDTYSKSELLLEKSRVLLVLGKAQEAQQCLEQAGELIFKFRHKRHSAILNLRYAYLSWVQGDSVRALTLLQAALGLLNSKVDKVLELKIKGLQFKILRDETTLSEVKQLTQQLSMPLSRRILARDNLETYNSPHGEDQIGDLIDDLKSGHLHSFEKVLKESCLGLLQHYLPRPGQFLLVDAVPGFIVVWNYGNAVLVDVRKSQLTRKILLLLAHGTASKEQVIEKVWEYQYDPLRHDSLIYQTMKNLRSEVGASLLETVDGKYQLNGRYEVLSFQRSAIKLVKEIEAIKIQSAPQIEINTSLNYRQNLFLQATANNEFISPQQYAKKFKISRITASRDLNELLKLHKVQLVGKGRSVRYVKVVS